MQQSILGNLKEKDQSLQSHPEIPSQKTLTVLFQLSLNATFRFILFLICFFGSFETIGETLSKSSPPRCTVSFNYFVKRLLHYGGTVNQFSVKN